MMAHSDEIERQHSESPHEKDMVEKKLDSSSLEADSDTLDAAPLTPTAAKKAQLSPIFTVLAAGSALVSDGYQNNVMSLLNTLFAKRYGSKVYTSDVSTRVSNSLTVGTILGQVIVGVVCDRIGRKAAIVIASVLLCIGAIFATGAAPIHGSTNALFWWLTVARGCIGVGVGAEYPASSSSASEAASERYSRKTRSTVFILCTNLVLSLGGPIASSYFLIILSATSYTGEQSPEQNARKLDIIWRLCFGFGALLPLSVFYFRIKMLTTKLYAESAIKHNVPYWLAVKRYWPRLIGTLGAWFLYDFVAFANSAFSSTVIATVVDNPTLKRTAEYQLLLGAIALPGAILGAYAVRYLGSKWLLIAGFTGYIIIGLIVGLAWDHIIKIPALFVVLYGLLASFGNFGPGSVMGLVSSDCYPTALRGTFYGLSAAVGKVGGVVGTEVFKPVQAHGKKYTFIVAACCGVVGVLLAFFFVPDTTRFDLAEQDKEWEQYLVRNGWDHVVGEGAGEKRVGDAAAKKQRRHAQLADVEDVMENETKREKKSDLKQKMTARLPFVRRQTADALS